MQKVTDLSSPPDIHRVMEIAVAYSDDSTTGIFWHVTLHGPWPYEFHVALRLLDHCR